jgi:transcriptional regulator with XRE-family HTH domain
VTRQQPLRLALVGRLRDEMARRNVSPEQLAKRAGYDARTMQRLLNGDTCSLETLERCESVLRVDLLDSGCRSSDEKRSETLQSVRPVVGWKAASGVLGVPVATLRKHRHRLGDRRRKPWWASEAALRFWYDQLVSGVL